MEVKNVGCEGVEFVKLSRDDQFSDQQMHLMKDNKIQIVKQFMVSPLHVSAPECSSGIVRTQVIINPTLHFTH